MISVDYALLNDVALIAAAFDVGRGLDRARAIVELAGRSLGKQDLLEDACRAISSDRRVGFHKGAPLGWFGADHIFLSGQERAICFLLKEMESWDATEQEDLVRHWAGSRGLEALTDELKGKYGWTPRYGKEPG